MSLEPCSKLTATDGRGAKVKWQWVPDNWSCDKEAPSSKHNCSGSWNERNRHAWQIRSLPITSIAELRAECVGRHLGVSSSSFSLQIENIMASLDAGLPGDCDVTANGVTSSSHNDRVAMTTTPRRQTPSTGASLSRDANKLARPAFVRLKVKRYRSRGKATGHHLPYGITQCYP